MGIGRLRDQRGQMTVELAAALPALIIVAVIAVNAGTFFADCAAFDRVSREAVRVHAASPAYGQGVGDSCSLVEQEIESALGRDNLEFEVAHGVTGPDFDEFRMTLSYEPTLFGMGLRSSVFGVALPKLRHEAVYVVDSYKPGVFV